MSDALRTYATLLDRLHRMIAAGLGDGEEADAVRDDMDRPWYAMSEAEIELVRTLSKDLYDVHENANRPRGEAVETIDEPIRKELEEADRREEWERLLSLLRTNRDRLPAWRMSYWRGRVWNRLGVPEAGATFWGEFLRQVPAQRSQGEESRTEGTFRPSESAQLPAIVSAEMRPLVNPVNSETS